MKKRVYTAALLLSGVLCLGGCLKGVKEAENSGGAKPGQKAEEMETAEEPSSAKNGEEGRGAKSREGEQEVESGKKAILVVSFGTSYNDSREVTIGAIEKAIAGKFPEFEVRRAFTSQIIIDKLKERDGLAVDNVEEALERAEADNVTTLIVQPTHLMDGFEYMDLAEALEGYKERFSKVSLAAPLLSSDADYKAVVQAITANTASYDDGETAICFMGHGTEADSNTVYKKLQETLKEEGFFNYYIGTVEAEPTLKDLTEALKDAGIYKKVVLEPLMVVSGDHANNDMAGDDKDSWKNVLEAEGYEVTCILRGLGELSEIRDIYADHSQNAIDQTAD